jgi:hypothetical protein
MPSAGLGLLAAAASAPTSRVGAVHGKDEEELDADESDDDEERPMSRDELKAKTLRGMSKRCVVACWL